ncbi:hypothetical protein RHDE110596_20440 [Prescottella defluvii]
MFLVPAVMKLLGDDCWWAPAWMKRIQEKIGLGEPILDSELPAGVRDPVATETADADSSEPEAIPARDQLPEDAIS